AREALARHELGARSFSPTGLQHFALCPYRFLLQAIHRLEPREEPVAIEILDPLTRGALFHDVQFEVLSELRAAGLLPYRPADLERTLATLDVVLERVAARYAEDLSPAIPRVWQDGIETIRCDLREWLRRAASAGDGFQERVVPLDAESRASAGTVADIVGRALADGFLPAAPVAGACRWCDYRPVCGPHEEARVARKPPERLAELARLRALR